MLLDVPEYVETISQFKNNLLAEYPQYNYANLLICYLKRGQDIMAYDDELINFDIMYYVIIKPIVCNEHSHSYSHSHSNNNNSLIINFDDSESEDETDDEMPDLE